LAGRQGGQQKCPIPLESPETGQAGRPWQVGGWPFPRQGSGLALGSLEPLAGPVFTSAATVHATAGGRLERSRTAELLALADRDAGSLARPSPAATPGSSPPGRVYCLRFNPAQGQSEKTTVKANGNLAVLRDHAAEDIKQAERSCWDYFVEFVKADLGADLAAWLDTTYKGWRLNQARATVFLRLPDCTEIALCYWRKEGRSEALVIANYDSLDWEPMPWNLSINLGKPMGRFAAVRYQLEAHRPEQARVEDMCPEDWFVSDNIDAVKAAAAEFAKEKKELEEQAKELIRDAIENIRKEAARR
jgi:hypothetical protein